jgi:hypothetical protein
MDNLGRGLDLLGQPAVALLGNGQLDTLALGQGHERLALVGANQENVGQTGGKGVAHRVLDVDNVKATQVALALGDVPDTARVAAASHHDLRANGKLDVADRACSLKIQLDRVVHLDSRVRVPFFFKKIYLKNKKYFFVSKKKKEEEKRKGQKKGGQGKEGGGKKRRVFHVRRRPERGRERKKRETTNGSFVWLLVLV